VKTYRILLTGLLVSLLAFSGLSGCGEKEEEAEEQEVVVSVETASPGVKSISLSYNYSGTVEANDVINVIPKVAGEVTEKYFEVGDHVNTGDLLFKMDDTSAQIALKQAEANLTSAQAGANSQIAVQASTYASATETLGKIPTNEQQLSNAVDSAYSGAVQAGAAKDTANASKEYAEKTYDNAVKALEDAITARDIARNAFAQAQASGDEETIAAAKKAYETSEANVHTAENAKNQAEFQKKSNENSQKSAEMQYYVAQEGYDMAVRNRNDYETYTKTTTLFGANAQMVGADAAVTNSKATVENAKAGVENAKLALGYTTVTSPVSGTITAINVTEHNMASQQSPAYVIQSDSKEKIVFYVAEETRKFVNPGNHALVTKNGVEFDAVIKTVGDTLDSETGLFKVEAEPSQTASDLITGSIVNVRTVTREAKNVITVPINSVYYDGEQAYVYTVSGDRAKKSDITTGLSDDKDTEVTEGISAQDQVILTYSAQLKDGVKIKKGDTDK